MSLNLFRRQITAYLADDGGPVSDVARLDAIMRAAAELPVGVLRLVCRECGVRERVRYEGSNVPEHGARLKDLRRHLAARRKAEAKP